MHRKLNLYVKGRDVNTTLLRVYESEILVKKNKHINKIQRMKV